jgi:hypothetical protein
MGPVSQMKPSWDPWWPNFFKLSVMRDIICTWRTYFLFLFWNEDENRVRTVMLWVRGKTMGLLVEGYI